MNKQLHSPKCQTESDMNNSELTESYKTAARNIRRTSKGRSRILCLSALTFIVGVGVPTPALPASDAAPLLFAVQGLSLPSMSVTDVTVEEGDPTIQRRTVLVPIEWSNAANLRIRIDVVRQRPADRVIVPSTRLLTLNGSGNGTIPVQVQTNLDRQLDHIAIVSLTFIGRKVLGHHQARLTVRDDDHPTVTVTDRNALEDGGVDGGAFHIIRLSKAINQPTDLRVRTLADTALPGRDYVAIDRTVRIPAGQTQVRVDVQLIGDNVIDLDLVKQYIIAVQAVHPGDIPTDVGATGRITDDDDNGNSPSAAIIQMSGDAIPSVGNLGGGCRNDDLPVGEAFINPFNAQFQLTLDHAMNRPFEVRIFTKNSFLTPQATAGSDFLPLDAIFVFPANTRSMTFGVQINDDGVSEPDEFFHVEAVGRMIAEAQPCEQNELGAMNEVKIGWNIF